MCTHLPRPRGVKLEPRYLGQNYKDPRPDMVDLRLTSPIINPTHLYEHK